MDVYRHLANAQRIGIVRTDHLGDMVLTLPLMRALKEEFPNASVALIAHSRTKPLVEGVPVVDECWYVDRQPLEEILETCKFDALFFPRARADEVWQAWRSRVRVRVGTAYRWWSILYNVRIPDHRSTAHYHEAEYNVRMLEHITGKRYRVELVPPPLRQSTEERVKMLLENLGLKGQKLLVLHPGGRGSAPRWGRFPELVQLLAQRIPEVVLVITGTTSEKELCNAVAQAAPTAYNLCGQLTLEELIALLRRSSVVVANSTGVLHIAAAIGVATVGLFPAEPPALSPARWGPLGEKSSVLAASPIGSITPEHVWATVAKFLA